MKGLESLLSSMIGLTPDQMKEIVEGLTSTAAEAMKLMQKIDADNQLILAKLEGKEE